MKDHLNGRQRAFVRNYLVGMPGVRGIACRAYREAGYNVTLRSARVCGSRLLRHPTVQKALDEYHEAFNRELAKLARDPMSDNAAGPTAGQVATGNVEIC